MLAVMYVDRAASASPSASTGCSRTARSRPTSPSQYAVRDPRLDGGPGPGHLVGRRPPQAPRAHRPGGRPALAARPRQRLQGRGQGPLVRAHGLAVRPPGPGAYRKYARDLVEDRGLPLHQPLFPLWVAARDRDPGRRSATRSTARSPRAVDRRAVGRRWCGSSCCTTSPGRSTPSATSSARAASRSRTTRPTCSGSRRCPSASPGTTTTTRSRARRCTACAGGRSTRPRG